MDTNLGIAKLTHFNLTIFCSKILGQQNSATYFERTWLINIKTNKTKCFHIYQKKKLKKIAILTTRRKHMLSPQQNNARIQKHEFFSLIGVIINNGKFGNFTHFLITNLQQSSVLPLIGDWLMRAARKFTFYNIKSGIWFPRQPPRLRGRNMHWWGEGLSPRSIRTLISKLHR